MIKAVDKIKEDSFLPEVGSEEFMTHAGENQSRIVTSKIERINTELSSKEDSLVCTSISVGIAHGSHAKDTATWFNNADSALYETKRRGKGGYTFYSAK